MGSILDNDTKRSRLNQYYFYLITACGIASPMIFRIIITLRIVSQFVIFSSSIFLLKQVKRIPSMVGLLEKWYRIHPKWRKNSDWSYNFQWNYFERIIFTEKSRHNVYLIVLQRVRVEESIEWWVAHISTFLPNQ